MLNGLGGVPATHPFTVSWAPAYVIFFLTEGKEFH
jgi:hypothetical protein